MPTACHWLDGTQTDVWLGGAEMRTRWQGATDAKPPNTIPKQGETPDLVELPKGQ